VKAEASKALAAKNAEKAESARNAESKGTEPGKPAAPPATIVFAVSPWGEIVVNGKSVEEGVKILADAAVAAKAKFKM